MTQTLDKIEFHHTVYNGVKHPHLLGQRMTFGILYLNDSLDALVCQAICSRMDQFSRERGRQITSGRLQKYLNTYGKIDNAVPIADIAAEFKIGAVQFRDRYELTVISLMDRSEKTEKERRKQIYKLIRECAQDGEFFESFDEADYHYNPA